MTIVYAQFQDTTKAAPITSGFCFSLQAIKVTRYTQHGHKRTFTM